MSRMVVALGGNALGNSPLEQLELVKQTAKALVELIQAGHEVIVTHGNGPQVGMIHLAMEKGSVDMPFPECGAMSQGYIGYHLQNALQNELRRLQIHKQVATIVTQVLVDEHDEAFQKPTKPIGSFYSESEAKILSETKGYKMVEDSGRGWRRVVPSPMPIDVVEKEVVKSLVDSGVVVITVGGGGIPVIETEVGLKGVPAVIDKDLASSTLADLLDADQLLILTAVPQVAIHFNQPNQEYLSKMTVAKAKTYMAEGHFAAGSMLPKIKAAIRFCESKPGRVAIIAALEQVGLALKGESGTRISL